MGYIQFNGNGNNYGMEFGTNADEKFAVFKRNSAVELYYDDVKKFETTPPYLARRCILSYPQDPLIRPLR